MDNQPSRKGAEDGLSKPPPEDASAATDAELLAQCRVDTFRAGGKGGQHQNKTDSAVRLVHEPSGITVIARDHRSQLRNKETALGRLRAQLVALAIPARPRVSTKIPVKERRQRVENKRKRSKVKALRKKPPPPED